MTDFPALLIEKNETSGQHVSLQTLSENALPAGSVKVAVEWSTINYKDALAITGTGPIVRSFPMIPGIDFAGVVEHSDDPTIRIGQKVLLNGWGVGEKHWGGLAGKARVPGEWTIPVPDAFSTRQTMAIGTAGYTAMLCVMALEQHGLRPNAGPVLVTGATGGVGSFAVMLLAKLGYEVTAMTGRAQEEAYLKTLGASAIISRDLYTKPGKPLERAQWAGAVDVAGGQVLASLCATMAPQGVVTACGLAAGMDLPLTVAPFILRGVSLIGVDSVQCPREKRLTAWARLAELVDHAHLDTITHDIDLKDVPQHAADLLHGKVRGRLAVKIPRS